MKKLFALSILSFTTVLSGAEDDWSLNNSYAVWGEYIHFRRTLTNKGNLIVDSVHGVVNQCNVCRPNDLCETKDVVRKFKFEPGFRVGFAYMSPRTTVEATYMLIREWTGHCSATAPGALFFSSDNPFILSDFSNADHAEVRYESHFENGEINYYRHVSPRKENYVSCSWLLGVRYIRLWEHMDLAYSTFATDTSPETKSDYEIWTNNYLGAAQIGGAIEWIPMKHLSWNFVIKVGMGYDWAKQRTFVRDFDNTVVVHDFEASDSRFPPFLADGAMTLAYQILKGMDLHVGYQLIYLNPLATAPLQIQKGEEYHHHVKIDGEVMIYGLFAGLTLSF